MSTPAAPAVECRALSVAHDRKTVLHQVDLQVGPRELLAVLGPSGSGKSTLLHAVAGFIAPLAGEIRMAGRLVANADRQVAPESRSVGVVFQSFALWPHLTILETVAYPARRRGVTAPAARAEAADLLGRLGLGGLLERRPAELSGGEQQRVGLARALARRPELFIFDEPTSQLDTPLRASLQREIDHHRRELGAAALFATHDFEEALALADRVALLREGRVVQTGSPAEIYERPADLWSARLSGPASVIVGSRDGVGRVAIAGVSVSPVGGTDPGTAAGMTHFLIRPDWVSLGGPLAGEVARVLYRGAHTDYHLVTPAGEIELRELGPPKARPGDPITWSLKRVWALDNG